MSCMIQVRTSLPGSNNESTATKAENLCFDIPLSIGLSYEVCLVDIRLRPLLDILVIFLSLISIIFEGFHTDAGCTSHDTVHLSIRIREL